VLHIAILAIAALAAAPSHAETIGGNPGPQYNYVCPNSDNKPALDCYFDAVGHLYTMCKHVKSIEIIEYGYEHSTEGTNGAKSESCVVKQKLNMARPYQAALKTATRTKKVAEELRGLHELWLKALAELAWKPGETDEAYKARTMMPYESFAERIVQIQTVIQLAEVKPATTTAAVAKKPVAKAPH
jgi:hypothetical protein